MLMHCSPYKGPLSETRIHSYTGLASLNRTRQSDLFAMRSSWALSEKKPVGTILLYPRMKTFNSASQLKQLGHQWG